MTVVTDLPPDVQPPDPVQRREALLDDPAVPATPDLCAVPGRAMNGVIPTARTCLR
jgi:hypothetical protein